MLRKKKRRRFPEREAPENEAEEVSEILKTEMENAVKLSVALTADVHSGRTWFDAKE